MTDHTTDDGDLPPSVRIAQAVADATDREPTDLPPLQKYLDADALDRLLSSAGGTAPEGFHLAFTYDGLRVRVDGDGAVEVEE